MITNATGEIALRYYQPAQVLANNTPTGKQYFFDVNGDVSMAWVDPRDVDDLLRRRGGCCNKKRKMYTYANENAVGLWTR
ncbi:MAG: hypothetical protein GY796_02135 [Chloroflexi bacterium]|nr:hypothetical protein [Chloroflexota bacterium]